MACSNLQGMTRRLLMTLKLLLSSPSQSPATKLLHRHYQPLHLPVSNIPKKSIKEQPPKCPQPIYPLPNTETGIYHCPSAHPFKHSTRKIPYLSEASPQSWTNSAKTKTVNRPSNSPRGKMYRLSIARALTLADETKASTQSARLVCDSLRKLSERNPLYF